MFIQIFLKNRVDFLENKWLRVLAEGYGWWWWGAYLLTMLINIGNMMCMIAPNGKAEHEDFSSCPPIIDWGRLCLSFLQILFWVSIYLNFTKCQTDN